MNTAVRYEIDDEIGVIRIENPPVNALSQAVREGLLDAVKNAQRDASRVLLLICEGRTFCAGADITEFGKSPVPPTLPDVLAAIEASPKPVVAAIHGTALGGGLELALACHYRCALGSAAVGFPEVKLGLLPGAGGTQRAPRLAGVPAALDLISSGKPVSASKAEAIHLLDHLIEQEDLFEAALEYARELVGEGVPPRRARDLDVDTSELPAGFFDEQQGRVAKKSRGLIAPQHIVSCVEASVTKPFDEALRLERELFSECMRSDQSAALRHLFFAERETRKVSGIDRETPRRSVERVGILGAGTMGTGIAMAFANANIPVTLLEIDDTLLAQGLKRIRKNYDGSIRKGRLTESEVERRIALIEGTTSYDELRGADLVIEAVFEDLSLKKEVFAKLVEACKPGCILASNTSYQNLDEIAAVTDRPADVIGMHFFSPAHVMKLLEVVRGAETSREIIATVMRLAGTIGKIPVLVGVCYGFVGNRMFACYTREAQRLLLEGATPEQVDAAMQAWGMAMGPLAVCDLAGLDVGYKVRSARRDLPSYPVAYRIADALVEMGHFGQKTGCGFYQYVPDRRGRTPNPIVAELAKMEADRLGIGQREIADEEICERLIYPLVNEGARILEEGIAQRSSDIDVIYVNGYGFPAYRGGPMFYADTLGLETVYESVCAYHARSDAEYWSPAPLLEKLATSGGSFGTWDSTRNAER